MTPQGREALERLMANLNMLAYPQPIVARAIGASMDDINTWRSRRYLGLGGYESQNRRVTYTGAGVIEAGLMSELAWLYGPVTASQIIGEHINFITHLDQDQDFKFLDYAITSARDDRAEVNGKVVEFTHLGGSLQHLKDDQGFQSHSMKICPVGSLILQWAISLQMST